MAAEIQPLTFRDLSYVAANMSAADWMECEAQLPEGATPIEVAAYVWTARSEHAYAALYRGQPVAAFGISQEPLRPWAWKAWMFGTDTAPKAVPAITRFAKPLFRDFLLRAGARRLEAISHERHTLAHDWLLSLGAHARCELPGYGRNGETYILLEWTRKSHVLFDEAAQAAGPAQAA